MPRSVCGELKSLKFLGCLSDAAGDNAESLEPGLSEDNFAEIIALSAASFDSNKRANNKQFFWLVKGNRINPEACEMKSKVRILYVNRYFEVLYLEVIASVVELSEL